MPGLGGVPSPGGGVDGVQFGPGVGGVCLVRGGVPSPGGVSGPGVPGRGGLPQCLVGYPPP